MSKELPYFKFEPGEWQNGNIQMCSIEARIAFIDICCTYWQRLCSLKYAFALQRHCNGNADIMQELCEAGVLLNNDGELAIKFLDSQLQEVSQKSNKARKAANKRWSDANAMQTHSERNAIREDKIREEEKRKSNKFTAPTISEIQQYAKEKKYVSFNAARFHAYYESNGWKVGKNKMKDWKAAARGWQSRESENTQVQTTVSKYDFL